MSPSRSKRSSEICLECLQVIFPVLVGPLCLTSFAYTCIYAYIYARGQSYGANDWQKCLVVPNIGNLHLDGNRFCSSASNFAGQAYLSLLVAVGGAYVGLKDNDLLPLSIYMGVYLSKCVCLPKKIASYSVYGGLVSILGIVVYRESYPYFVDPHFESTTLVTLTKYIQPSMYDLLQSTTQHLPVEMRAHVPPPHVCHKAYHVNLAFLCVQYGILAVAIMVLALCIYALAKRPHKKLTRPYTPLQLRGRWLHIFFGVTGFLGMITVLISKEVVADTAIEVGRNSGHPTSYPFEDNNLDLVSISTLVVIGSVLHGLCKPCVRSFLLAAAAGCINLTRTIPGMVGTMAGYSGVYYPEAISLGRDGVHVEEGYYVLWHLDECVKYVFTTNKVAFKNDPFGPENARCMCKAFMWSIGGQLAASVSILGLVLASIHHINANSKALQEAEIEEEEEDVLRHRKRHQPLPSGPFPPNPLTTPLLSIETKNPSAPPASSSPSSVSAANTTKVQYLSVPVNHCDALEDQNDGLWSEVGEHTKEAQMS